MQPTPQTSQKHNIKDDDSDESGQQLHSDSDNEENTAIQPSQIDENEKKSPTETKKEPRKEEPIEEKKSRRIKPERSQIHAKKQKKSKDAKLPPSQPHPSQSFDQQWDAKAIQSDQGQLLISDQDQPTTQPQSVNQTAFYQQEDVNNLSHLSQQQQMNNAYIQKQTSIKYQHWVQNKHLLVLYLLFRRQIFAMFPKRTYNRIDIHPANKNKIRIFGTSPQQIKQVSTQISSLINKIAILKLNIRNEQAVRLKSSKLLNQKLLKDKMVIFRFGNPGDKSYYLGGKGTQTQLACVFKEMRNLKFRYFRMFDYPNTRSYNIILGNVIKQKQFLKAFAKWNLKNLQLVPYIPNFSTSSSSLSRKQDEKSLCFLMTTIGNFDNFSPKEIENNLAMFIKNNFYSIVLIFRKGDKYLPKLMVEGVVFKYVGERSLSWGYVYVMCLKKNFFDKREAIIAQLQKLAERKVIFGARFFNHISPQRSQYLKPQIYKQVKFPEDRPAYSYSIIARQIKPQIPTTSPKQQTQLQGEMKQKQFVPKKYYSFDWKEHLMNFHPTETSFIQQVKK